MDRRQEIERLAYELFQRNGCISGKDVEHWLEAEKIIREKYSDAPKANVHPKMKAEAKPVEKPDKPEKTAERSLEKKFEPKESKPGKKAAPAKEKARKAGTSRKEATI